MMERFELASRAWIEELFRLFREAARQHPEVTFSVCEVFTHVPRRLDPDGEGNVAWHGFIRNGEADLCLGEVAVDAVDVKTIGEWEAIAPLARHKIDLADPQGFARYQALTEQAAAEGRIQRFGDRSRVPLAFVGIHNALAERTA